LEMSASVLVPKLLHTRQTAVTASAITRRSTGVELIAGCDGVPPKRLATKSELNRAVLVIPMVMQM
jgi:hypothetical protein